MTYLAAALLVARAGLEWQTLQTLGGCFQLLSWTVIAFNSARVSSWRFIGVSYLHISPELW